MSKGKKVLVVDDTDSIRYVLRPVLELEGYNVSVAAGGKEALKKVKNDKPDLILLDIMMPQFDGWDVLKGLKKEKIKVPVIMMSARDDEQSRLLAKKVYNTVGFISKPFYNKDLVAAIKKALKE